MIKSVSLRNFRCFESIELNLTGAYGVPLRYAVIYGMNAAGKTSLIEAIRFLEKSIRSFETASFPLDVPVGFDDDVEIAIDRQRSAMATGLERMARANMMEGAEDGMELSFKFSISGKDASYSIGFSDTGQLIGESLKYISGGGRSIVYYAVRNDDGCIHWELNHQAFGSDLLRNKLDKVIPAYWGRFTLISMIIHEIGNFNRPYLDDTCPLLMDVIRYFVNLDSGIFASDEPDMRKIESNLEHGWMNHTLMKKLDAYRKAIERFFTRIDSDMHSVHYEFVKSSSYDVEYLLYFDRVISGKVRSIPFYQESSGMRKLLGLLPMLLRCASGKVSYMDEMESGIHDKLMRDLFLQVLPEMEGQMIVTTHNTSLLKELDPHNVFTLNIDSDGRRRFVKLSSISRTRESNNNQARYMRGELGDVPVISSVDLQGILHHLREDLE